MKSESTYLVFTSAKPASTISGREELECVLNSYFDPVVLDEPDCPAASDPIIEE